uniref:ribosomal RNA processing protein 1 homolog B-like n=1 Tax=Semicossyphus pulcher TaxID=241346 RepID=UPI0037E82F83
MASIQEPEVQFAQRLASNEKPIRTKAIKKLRKYINVRSQKESGGFTGDELLKLWKGLFYCLWMQDKPLLQEELSNQISGLINSFQDVEGQILYLESFLQTFKREWTGIDRLRMDKFFQLVRFMFRQTFELLKKKNWESSVVSRFLEVLTAQLLQSASGAPSGLQFHILDLYMTELAAVGSAELTAEQNLTFIEPFCKTAAKTKDRSLFGAICNSIFSTIIDQAPFAICELMKEVKGAHESDSDSGQASEEDDEEETTTSKLVAKRGKQVNGTISDEQEEEDDDDDDDDEEDVDVDDDDDDELLHLEESDTEEPGDEDIGPVLQFDYTTLADKLFQLASRSSTPSRNRQRLYKIIKVLRDISEGVFPQDEYPEEVSTDEDDDMFGSRKRMKRGGRHMEDEEEEGEPAAKKKKKKGKKKEASKPDKQSKDSGKDDSEAADETANNDKKKKKKRKKKKKKAGQGEETTKVSEEGEIVAVSTSEETEGAQTECSQEDLAKEQTESSVSSVKVTEAATAEGPPETLVLSEVQKQPSVTVTEESSQQTPCSEQSENLQSKKLEPEAAEEQPAEPQTSSEVDAAVSEKKKKKKKGLKSQTDGTLVDKEAEITTNTPETPAKKKKGLKAKQDPEECEADSQVNGASTEADLPAAPCEDSVGNEITDAVTLAKKRRKKKSLQAAADEAQKVEPAAEEEEKQVEAEIPPQDETTVPLKKRTKKRSEEEETAEPADESAVTPLKKKRKNNQKESAVSVEEEAAVVEAAQVLDAEEPLCENTMTTPAKKKKKKAVKPAAAAQVDDIKDPLQVAGSEDAELQLGDSEVLSSSGKAAKKKKKKIPVVFEFEADELEAAASINGLAEEETNGGSDVGEPSTPLSTKKTKKKAKAKAKASSGSDFITFQSNAGVPTPLFCKTKGGPRTPLSSKKKSLTPKSESKKVTFGLKNNKTAEFRKTDRSLLVSPDGSSRVPFDPQQKPKFGVLKSPPTPLSIRVKKTPKGKKSICNTPKSTPKRRPSAADFF